MKKFIMEFLFDGLKSREGLVAAGFLCGVATMLVLGISAAAILFN